MAKKLRCGFLLSGGGSTFENMMQHINSGAVDAEIAIVVSSRANVRGLALAQKWNVPTEVIDRKSHPDPKAFSSKITGALEAHGPLDLIIMGGWMCFYELPEKYLGKVINIHPALIPAFCGKKMYGHHVHEAVLNRGVKFTGCTVHFVDNIYDHGPIISQSVVPVKNGDTVESLAERVQEEERKLYPRAVQLIAEGKIEITGAKTIIKE